MYKCHDLCHCVCIAFMESQDFCENGIQYQEGLARVLRVPENLFDSICMHTRVNMMHMYLLCIHTDQSLLSRKPENVHISLNVYV